jgi:3-methyladenine DNA glycosylase AlkD
MLREAGKRDLSVLESFLNKNYKSMPRTMLRYAIERLPKERKQFYMQK